MRRRDERRTRLHIRCLALSTFSALILHFCCCVLNDISVAVPLYESGSQCFVYQRNAETEEVAVLNKLESTDTATSCHLYSGGVPRCLFRPIITHLRSSMEKGIIPKVNLQSERLSHRQPVQTRPLFVSELMLALNCFLPCYPRSLFTR